ncbi:MAG TPA: divalent cation tolerance protein CutA, partial [Myxococcus sp.]|nr:divalent cation tolerance protein CutA [Myxococcus sp.]
MATDVILVLVTAPSTDKAAELARALVEEGLAACGN